jgi:cytochrome P450
MTAIFSTDKDFVRIAEVCVALGVPQDDWVLFWRWADELPAIKAVDELNAYVDVLIADRCRRTAGDLLSQLIQLEVDGEELTVDDIRRLVATLVAGACVLTEIDVMAASTRTLAPRYRFGRPTG